MSIKTNWLVPSIYVSVQDGVVGVVWCAWMVYEGEGKWDIICILVRSYNLESTIW